MNFMATAQIRAQRRLAATVVTLFPLLLAGCGGGGSQTPESRAVTGPEEAKIDLSYALQSPAQRLDLLLPNRTGVPVPLVITIHGGGWMMGDKRDLEWMVAPLRAQGYAVASINYRLSGEASFPAAIVDAKAAVRWLRAHAGQYGLDPGRFAVWGFSAGGNLAALIGLTADSGSFDDPELGSAGVSSAVQAVADFYGPADLLAMDEQFAADRHCPDIPDRHDVPDSPESRYLGGQLTSRSQQARKASPIHYVAAASSIPPFFITHGRDDCTVPDRQSAELARALQQKGVRTQLEILPGFGHASPEFDRQQAAPAMRFISEALGAPISDP